MNHYALNPKILREYDIRGIVDKEFGIRDAYLIGKGYGTQVKRAGGDSIVAGYDGRLTSVELEKALVEGLRSAGLHITRVGLGPSPMTYFAGFHLQTDAAIMVTGSHNPASYNGFKMTLFKKSYFGEQIKALGKLIEKEDFETGVGTVKNYPIEESYIDYLTNDFKTYYSAANFIFLTTIHSIFG